MSFEIPNQVTFEQKKQFELSEGDREFLEEGWDKECKEAKERNNWSRAIFLAARMSEFGMKPEVEDEAWQRGLKALEFKKSKADGWGMAYQARYLKEIDETKALNEIQFSEEEKQIMFKELQRRQDDASNNNSRWGDFIAMLEHVKKITPEIAQNIHLNEETEKGVEEHLKQRYKDKDWRYFVHLSNAFENASPGALERYGFSQEELNGAIGNLSESMKEDKSKGDAWAFAFAASQIYGLQKSLKDERQS